MSFSTELFNNHMKSVYNWNTVARNFNMEFNASDIERQTDYVAEEIFETIGAVATDDIVEVIDGICDTFVTLSFKHTLTTGEREFGGSQYEVDYQKGSNNELKCAVIAVLTQIQQGNIIVVGGGNTEQDLVQVSSVMMDMLHQLMQYIDFAYNVDIDAAMTEVMDSNWSKFPVYIEGFDYEAECKWIEATHGKVDVKHNVVEIEGVKRVVFRDNGGAGKVCKPSVFRNPDISKLLP